MSVESGEHDISRIVASKRSKTKTHSSSSRNAFQPSVTSPKKATNNNKQSSSSSPSSLMSPDMEHPHKISLETVTTSPGPGRYSNDEEIIDLTIDDDDDGDLAATESTRKAVTGTMKDFFTPKTPVSASSSSAAVRPKVALTGKKPSINAISRMSSLMGNRVYNFNSLQNNDHAIAEIAAKQEFNVDSPKAFIINDIDGRHGKDPVVILPLSLVGRLKDHQVS